MEESKGRGREAGIPWLRSVMSRTAWSTSRPSKCIAVSKTSAEESLPGIGSPVQPFRQRDRPLSVPCGNPLVGQRRRIRTARLQGR